MPHLAGDLYNIQTIATAGCADFLYFALPFSPSLLLFVVVVSVWICVGFYLVILLCKVRNHSVEVTELHALELYFNYPF